MKINRHITAFTILELSVSLFIIVIIMTLSTVSYQRANSRNAIIMAAYQLAGDLRLAESYGASAKQYGDDPTDNVWGVYFNMDHSDQYKIFVDKNFDGLYDDGHDAIWRTVKLPANIVIKKIKITKGGQPFSPSLLSVVYFPPAPTSSIAIDSGDKDNDEAVITLEDEINLSTKEITVNFFGLIDVTK